MNVRTQLDMRDDARVIPSVLREAQLDLFGNELIDLQPSIPGVHFEMPEVDVNLYDKVIVAFSGGKDSIACVLRLMELGVKPQNMELWHHLVDGSPEESVFMDWECMDSYCEQFAKAIGAQYFRSYLDHGFKGEMLKENSRPHGHTIETPTGLIHLDRKLAKEGTRMRFPQVAASLQTRWCSSELKIVVGNRAMTSQPRFEGGEVNKVLFVTGERRQESSNRARYSQLEPHASDTCRKSAKPRKPRFVDNWKAVLHMDELEIWEIMERWRVRPPVPYRLGWGRSSCALCIFNGDRIWSTLNEYFPDRVKEIAEYEKRFDLTIARSGLNVLERANSAKPMIIEDQTALIQSQQSEYTLPIFLDEKEKFILPIGAFSSESSGAS